MTGVSRTCDLCGLPILGKPVTPAEDTPCPDGVTAEDKEFCCAGCAQVWSVAAANGMTELLEGPVRPPADSAAGRAEAVAAALRSGARRSTLRVDGMWCSSCSLILETGLTSVPGVLDAEVSYAASLARVIYDPDVTDAGAIAERAAVLGYRPSPAGDPAAHMSTLEVTEAFLRFFVGLAATMWVMWLSFFVLWPAYTRGVYAGGPIGGVSLLCAVLSLVVLLYPGWTFLYGALQAARVGRMTMDTLVVLGTWSAWLYSVWAAWTGTAPTYFDAAAGVTVIVLLGRWIEIAGKTDAARAVEGLQRGMPEEVWLVPGDGGLADAAKAPLVEATEGRLIAVRPGERIPTDGVIVTGSTSVDQSRLTGEPLPAERGPGDEVFAGTINVGEPVLVTVSRCGDATLAGRIAQIVEDAAFAKSATQRMTDTVASLFVPSVVALAAVTFLLTLLAEGLPAAVQRAVTVLVVSCPCALGLATPLAVLNAEAAGSRNGMLIRGGVVLERAGELRVAAFDKTGTLTEGRPSVSAFIPADLGDEARAAAMGIAATLEAGSSHPVAHAISERGAALCADVVTADETETLTGLGVIGRIDGHRVLVGSQRLLEREGTIVPPAWAEEAARHAERGRTVVWVATGGDAVAGIALADRVRDDARQVVEDLGRQGLVTVIVSGDSEATSAAVAEDVGADEVRAELMPHEKETAVRELATQGPVMFVGDGINDAPALAGADLAVALGSASDVALAASDVVLLGEAGGGAQPLAPLGKLPAIARRARRIIRQNLAWAFVYNAVAIPLAIVGVLSPISAAVAMTVSSLAVVLNSLRARRVPGRPRARARAGA